MSLNTNDNHNGMSINIQIMAHTHTGSKLVYHSCILAEKWAISKLSMKF